MFCRFFLVFLCIYAGLTATEVPPPPPLTKEVVFPFFTWGQFLIWEQEPNDCYYGEGLPNAQSTSITLKAIPPTWSPGFRIGIGYNSHLDFWDVRLQWTCFNTSPSTHFLSNGDNFVIPNDFILSGVTGYMQKVSSKLTSHLNVLEIDLGRPGAVGSNTFFRPFVGIRSLWLHLRYFNTFVNFSENFSSLNMRTHMWGIGPRIGIEGSWNFTKTLQFFGHSSTSAIVGNITTNQRFFSPSIDSYEVTRQENFAIRPATCYVIGVAWCHPFKKRSRLTLSLQWEINSFSDVWPVLGVNVPSSRYVNMQGINLGARLDF